MSEGEDTNLVACRKEAIQREIAGFPVGDHELAQLTLNGPSDHRVVLQQLDGASNGYDSCFGSVGVLVDEKLEESLEIRERIR